MTRIFLTGPESTGKSMLTIELAKRFNGIFITEYARDYLQKLNRQYTYEDVLHIAKKQVELLKQNDSQPYQLCFVDTCLIITKIWFRRVFSKIPDWIDSEILKTKNDLYLLCKPDIPWVPDPLRENGGEMREILFNEYENELLTAQLHYSYVEGAGELRIQNAIMKINEFLSLKKHEERI